MQYIFTYILPAGSRILSVRMQCRWASVLAGTVHSAGCMVIQGQGRYACWQRHGLWAWYRGRQAWHPWWCVWHHQVCMASLKSGTVSLSLAPAIRVHLAPRMAGPWTVRLLATVSLAPETASLVPVTVLCSVRVHARLLNKFTLICVAVVFVFAQKLL